ncbi:uncharacterized protein LOC144877605 [Branchiostoma floridae x Branchiostoma japonicum]
MSLSKPSSPDPVYTPGTARGAKLASLLVDEGTALVRKIFEGEVQNMKPPSLRKQLGKHKKHLIGLRHLNPGQKRTLYPQNGDTPDTAQRFDISLLELLLKELCGTAPYPGPRNRLRQYRNNNYGHISSTDLSEGDFNRLWEELTEILVALGGDTEEISERLNQSIDPEQEVKYFTLLEKLYKEDMEVKDLLLAEGKSLRKGQEEVLDQGKSLLVGQETLLAQGVGLKVGQDRLLAQGVSLKNQSDSLKRGQDHLSTQGESLKKGQDELLAQGEIQKKGQEEILEELRNFRHEQSIGTDFGQSENSTCSTGWASVPGDVITCLKDHYATEYAHVRPLPWCEDFILHLEEVYTNLRLQQRDGRGRFQNTGSIIVSLTDVYNTREGKGSQGHVRSAVRKIRVEGNPGIGKSCSCQKLAYDWSCGKLDRFKAVFFLEMRHLAGKVKYAIFEQLLPKDTKTTPDQLWTYIQENQDDVLFILDGLDELSQTAREVTDVVDLIQGKILRNCHVLVTSRPYHCVNDLDKCHQFYKIVGYSRESSEGFIKKYFCQSPGAALKLVEQIHGNENLSELVVNPLNNVLICVVWEDNNNKLPSSKAELYEMIILSVAKRFCTKKPLPMEGDQFPPNIEEALRDLRKLSWEGLEQEQLQFSIDEITRKYETTADNMLNMGLLTRDYSFSRIRRTCFCAFLHKSFQEYMAARYISGLVTDESSREEGMKCLRSLFCFTNSSDIDRELILSSCRKYKEVHNWLLLILGENADPLFDMFAEELNKAQTDEDRKVLSFVCIMWLGKTKCSGVKMAEIVAPFLPQHLTNNNILRDMRDYYDDRFDWFIGLTHVLTCQKKLAASNNQRFTQHLTVDCGHITASSSEQEKLDLLENTLSDYDKIRSVTLLDHESSGSTSNNFSPLRTFIPRCGTESLSILVKPGFTFYLSLLSLLEQLSEAPMVEHIRITVGVVERCLFGPDVDFSEYDKLLAHVISRQSCLRSIRLEIGEWSLEDPEIRGSGNLTATLQSISQHASLEVVEFDLPRNDVLTMRSNLMRVYYMPGMRINEELMRIITRHEEFNVEPMVHELTECIKKNKVLKTLRLSWHLWDNFITLVKSNKIYHGICSRQSLSSLCSAIRRNRTLETLEIDNMFSVSRPERQAKIIANLLFKQQQQLQQLINYKQLRIIMFPLPSVEYCVMFPAFWAGHHDQ